MKKNILLTVAAASILSFSAAAFADETECDYYLRIDGAASWLRKVKGVPAVQDIDTGNNTFSTLKFKATGSLGIGAGYYIADNARAELDYLHVFKPKTKKRNSHISIRPHIDAIFAKLYYDLYDFEVGKLFVGAGAGVAFNKVKVHGYTQAIENGIVHNLNVEAETKRKHRFAYTLAVGSSFCISEGVLGEIQYNWSDFGKTSPRIKSHEEVHHINKKIRLRAHNVSAGLRFDI